MSQEAKDERGLAAAGAAADGELCAWRNLQGDGVQSRTAIVPRDVIFRNLSSETDLPVSCPHVAELDGAGGWPPRGRDGWRESGTFAFSVANEGPHARHCPDRGLHQRLILDEGGEAGREGDDDVQGHADGARGIHPWPGDESCDEDDHQDRPHHVEHDLQPLLDAVERINRNLGPRRQPIILCLEVRRPPEGSDGRQPVDRFQQVRVQRRLCFNVAQSDLPRCMQVEPLEDPQGQDEERRRQSRVAADRTQNTQLGQAGPG